MANKKLLLVSLVTNTPHCGAAYSRPEIQLVFTYRWLDTVVHILGGFWVALTALWVALRFKHIDTIVNYRRRALLIILASVAIMGIAWELLNLPQATRSCIRQTSGQTLFLT